MLYSLAVIHPFVRKLDMQVTEKLQQAEKKIITDLHSRLDVNTATRFKVRSGFNSYFFSGRKF